MSKVLLYLSSYVLLLALGVIVIRYLVPRDYLKLGKLSPLVAVLQSALFIVYGGFPTLYLQKDWPAVLVPPFIHVIGILLVFIGLSFLFYGMLRLGISRSVGRGTAQLEQSRIYSRSRNPQAVACGLFVIGFLMLWPTWYAVGWAALYFVLIHMMVLSEEEHLARIHGHEYENYCERVPRYIGRQSFR